MTSTSPPNLEPHAEPREEEHRPPGAELRRRLADQQHAGGLRVGSGRIVASETVSPNSYGRNLNGVDAQ